MDGVNFICRLQVVGGLPTLQTIEDIETDNKDRPIEDVRLMKATVFVNPFQEADDEVCGFLIDKLMVAKNILLRFPYTTEWLKIEKL